MSKGLICVDFDGVVHSYTSGYADIDVIPDPPVDGAFKALKGYISSGFEVAIFSSRSSTQTGIAAMIAWFEDHGWNFKLYNLQFPVTKPTAKIHIDDRAYHFEGKFPTAHHIETFKPWNRQ